MQKIYLVSDTHFNHENIIKYCNRPFKDIYEMNDTIIKNWNSLIKENDIVYHLGDFGFGTKEELKTIFDKLNGKKYLIMGNHDKRSGKKFYKELGFLEVYKEYQIGNILLTHYPQEVLNLFNFYGHIHDKEESLNFKDNKHRCICLEKTNYMPVEIEVEDDLYNRG